MNPILHVHQTSTKQAGKSPVPTMKIEKQEVVYFVSRRINSCGRDAHEGSLLSMFCCFMMV